MARIGIHQKTTLAQLIYHGSGSFQYSKNHASSADALHLPR